MKVAVLNYTGTVGKTTIAAHLLAPRMGDAPIFAIETINETVEGLGLDVEKMRGEQFKGLFNALLKTDNAIIDVGASNVEEFLNGMARFEDSHMEIDCFIVPVTSGTKETKETISMISSLEDFSIPPEKIRIIFNRVETDVEEEFATLIQYAKKHRSCTVNIKAAIAENELFDLLAIKKLSIGTILADETDYKTKIKELGKDGDKKLRDHYADMHVMKSLAKSVNRNLDTAFEALFE
ncbi:plasmid stability protein StbB [Methylocaldum sp. BRCS4]|uniref:StbB family protein n=1 Tax=Methylocaldum sp. GT1BW TaxID=3438964 RepID=UPI0012EBF28D|nr:plasmid stability protein StbB [Methylocaldum sp. BRCS4]